MQEDQNNLDGAAFIIAYVVCAFSGGLMGFGVGVFTSWFWWG